MVAKHDESAQTFCTLTECPTFSVKKYLHQLQQYLPCVPPIPDGALKSLHKTQDYKGMVRLIKRTMNIEGVTLRVLWVPEGAAQKGKQKDAPAWIEAPANMPFYGSKAFREMTLDVFFRKSHLKQWTYDRMAIAVAHELSHVVLDSIRHPLNRCEKAVDLTAMLLGFRRLYVSGSRKETRSGNTTTHYQLGYLSHDEVQLADHILTKGPSHPKIKVVPSSPHKLIIGTILSLVVGVAALVGAMEFYSAGQLHQTPMAKQTEVQRQLSQKVNSYTTLVDVRVGPTTRTNIYMVSILKKNFALAAEEREYRIRLCANGGDTRTKPNDGMSYIYEFWDRTNAFIGRFEIASCP